MHSNKNKTNFIFKTILFHIQCALCAFCLALHLTNTAIANSNAPMPTDTRIKTFIYNPNEIFQVKFMVGYQSIIELQKNEDVELITFGDATPWNIRTLGRRIFLKATEPGLKTNMTIITDKRTYLLEIMSNGDDDDNDERITYILRFFYPDINVDIPPTTTKLAKIALNKRIAANTRSDSVVANSVIANAGALNTNYTYSSKGKVDDIMPLMIFDNGSKTYFKFSTNETLPLISVVTSDFQEIPLRVRISGEYVYVDAVEQQLTIRKDNNVVCVFNEMQKNKAFTAYVNQQ